MAQRVDIGVDPGVPGDVQVALASALEQQAQFLVTPISTLATAGWWRPRWENLTEARHTMTFSPPFPCLTVVGRERGAGTSSTQIV